MAGLTEYKFVGRRADTVSVGSKSVPVSPGDIVKLSEKDVSNNSYMVDENLLVRVHTKKEDEKEVKND